LSNDEATHTSPVTGSIAGQYVPGLVCGGPLFCQSNGSAPRVSAVGDATAGAAFVTLGTAA
jgi:hypothetical protein